MRKVFRLSGLLVSAVSFLFAGGLAACDFSSNASAPAAHESEPDRFHARTFAWDGGVSSPLAKASPPRARVTTFESREALGEALRTLERELERPGAADSLWKPLDHSCPLPDLALWNRYGVVRLRDSLLLDEELLKARCGDLRAPAPLQKSMAHATGEAQHRVYPYKMLGRAWSERDLLVTRGSGAETQFKKERAYFGMMGWWDTDATRIGVRLYLLDCGGTPRVCYSGGHKSNWHRNSASVLQTDFAGWNETRTQTTQLPAGVKRIELKVSAAVLAMHSADHAGIRFRAVSSAGLAPSTALMNLPTTEYVTW